MEADEHQPPRVRITIEVPAEDPADVYTAVHVLMQMLVALPGARVAKIEQDD